jgi:glycosyltransferase involved in cell wall biosynthesis
VSAAPRLLFVLTAYPDGGGISSILENFVAELGPSHDLHVAIVDERPGRRERLHLPDERVHLVGHRKLMEPVLFPSSLLFAAHVGRSLRRLVKRIDPDAVIVQDSLNLSAPGVAATRGLRSKLVLMDHGSLTNVYDPDWYPMMVKRFRPQTRPLFAAGFRLDAAWRALRWRIGVRYADELWMTGEELKPWFARAGARTHSYRQTLPWGFEPPSGEQRAEARRELGLPVDATVLNLVSRLDGEKGLDTVLDAFEGLRALDSSVRFLVAGDGSLHDWFAAEVERRGLESTISMVGRLDRAGVLRLQQASDFHVYAGTISCGVSICLLEAMACGVIPVVSDVPRAQIELAGDCGWVFQAGDAAALREALTEALATTGAERQARRAATVDALSRQPEPGIPELVSRLVGVGTTDLPPGRALRFGVDRKG